MSSRGSPTPAAPVSARVQIAALWTALMLLCLYADLFSFYRPGYLAEVAAGKMGRFDVSQGTLLAAAALMAVPALMVALTPLLPRLLCRWSNVVLGGALHPGEHLQPRG